MIKGNIICAGELLISRLLLLLHRIMINSKALVSMQYILKVLESAIGHHSNTLTHFHLNIATIIPLS